MSWSKWYVIEKPLCRGRLSIAIIKPSSPSFAASLTPCGEGAYSSAKTRPGEGFKLGNTISEPYVNWKHDIGNKGWREGEFKELKPILNPPQSSRWTGAWATLPPAVARQWVPREGVLSSQQPQPQGGRGTPQGRRAATSAAPSPSAFAPGPIPAPCRHSRFVSPTSCTPQSSLLPDHSPQAGLLSPARAPARL